MKHYPRQCLFIAAPPYLLGGAGAYFFIHPGAAPLTQTAYFFLTVVIVTIAECRLACAFRDVFEGRLFGATPFAPIIRKRGYAVVLGYLLKWLMAVFGVMLLLLPGIYLLILYFGIPILSTFEDLGIRAARARSRDLARKNLGRVAATIGVFDVAAICASIAPNLLLRGTAFETHVSVVGWVIGLVILPLRAALGTAVYLDCRVRSEGYDLDGRLTALEATQTTA